MPRTIRISGWLYACLVMLYMHTADALYLAGPMIGAARQEAWLLVLLTGAIALAVALLVVWAAGQFRHLRPVEAMRAAFGRWIGGLFGLFYAGVACLYLTLSLRDVQEFVTMILLPDNPGWFVSALMAAAVLYAVWSGLEPVARLAFPITVTVAAIVVLTALMLIPEYHVFQLAPFLYRGPQVLAQGVRVTLPSALEVLFIASLLPYVPQRERLRGTVAGVVSGYVVLAVNVVSIVLVLGSVLPTRLIFPIYDTMQMVSISEVLERVEAILVIVWLCGMYIELSFWLYTSAEALADALGLAGHRFPAAVLSLVAVGGTQIAPGVIPFIQLAEHPAFAQGQVAGMGLLLLSLLVAALLLRLRQGVRRHA